MSDTAAQLPKLQSGQQSSCAGDCPLGPQYAYNYLFSELVENDDDLTGMVAYTIYKRHKIAWLVEHKERHGREPHPSELETFNAISKRDLAGYTAQAEQVLQRFMTSALSSFADDITEQLNERYEHEIAALDRRIEAGCDMLLERHRKSMVDHLDKRAHGPIRTVSEHMIAGILSAVLSGLLFFGLAVYFGKNDVVSRVMDALKSPPPAGATAKPSSGNVQTP